MTSADLDEKPYLELTDAAVRKILETEDFGELLRWMQAPGRLTAAFPLPEPELEKPLAAVLARLVWNATPLPGNRYRPRPLSKPQRNDPCFCGSGRKYKQCCALLPPLIDLDPEEIWAFAVNHLSPEQLEQAHAEHAIPPALLHTLAAHYMEDGRYGKVVELLEPLFGTGSLKRLDERHELALNILCDAYDACGWRDEKLRLLNQLTEQAPKPLRAAAWERLATIQADAGDMQGAWQAFRQAQRAAPDSPTLSVLEVTLLTTEGRLHEASERARFWRHRLERDPEIAPEFLAFLDGLADDPQSMLDEIEAVRSEPLRRLLQCLERVQSSPPAVSYGLESWEEDPEETAAFGEDALQEDLFGPPHAEVATSSQVLVASDDLEALEERWHECFPMEKPFSTHPFPLSDDDPWEEEVVDEWLAFLTEHSEAFDSVDILDDLVVAIDAFYQEGGGSVGQRISRILIERGITILDALEQARPGLQLHWGILENRPILRLLARYALLLQDQGETDAARLRMEQLLRLNPDDNHGIRCLLTRCYLEQGDDQAMLDLYRRYNDDCHVDLPLGAALAHYRRGEMAEAVEALYRGHQLNAHVIRMLTARRPKKPKIDSMGIHLGGQDQAWLYRELMLDCWQAVPGALDWLKQHRPRGQ